MWLHSLDVRFFEECILLHVHRWVIGINPDVNFLAKLCTIYFYFCPNKGVGLVNSCSIYFKHTSNYPLFFLDFKSEGRENDYFERKRNILENIFREHSGGYPKYRRLS